MASDNLKKIVKYGIWLVVFLFPWQTRWIFKEAMLNGGVWEYGRLSLYLSEFILLLVLLLEVIRRFLAGRKKDPKEAYAKLTLDQGIFWTIILFLAVWLGLSVVWADSAVLSFSKWLKLIELICLAWLISQFDKTAKQKLSLVFIGSMALQSVLGFWQWFSQSIFSSKWLGLASHQAGVLGDSVIEVLDGRFLRVYGALPHPNIFAGFLAVAILLAIILYVEFYDRRIKKIFLLSAIGLMTAVLFLTFSRSGILALALGLTIFGLSLIKRKLFKRIIPAVLLLALLGVSFLLVYRNFYASRVLGNTRLENISNSERVASYGEAWPIIKKDWLTGVGWGNYTIALAERSNFLPGWQMQPVHNFYLLFAAESGLIGFILFLAIVFYLFRQKSEYLSLIVVLLVLAVFDHFLLSLFAGNLLWALAVGLSLQEPPA